MGSDDQIEIMCPRCKECFSAYCYTNYGSCDITLDDHPDTKVQADPPFYSAPEEDDWANYDAPDDPNAVFMDTYHHTGELLAEHGGEGAHLLNRMIFAQQVSSLEAYLADTLINTTMDNEKALQHLLASDTDLAKEKFTLAQIVSEPEFVKIKVRSYLRSIVYHNMPKVRALYKVACDIDIFELLGDVRKEKLFKAIELRHDCVHRNGRDKDGQRLEVFTKAYVQEIADIMKSLVGDIENKIHGRIINAEDVEFPF
jgi:hypothetical protein